MKTVDIVAVLLISGVMLQLLTINLNLNAPRHVTCTEAVRVGISTYCSEYRIGRE